MGRYRFRVLGGQYQDMDGVRHNKGAIVESDEDLREKFTGIFDLIPDPPRDPVSQEAGEAAGGLVLSGQYQDMDGVRHNKGAIVESDEDLREKFTGIFDLIPDPPRDPVSQEAGEAAGGLVLSGRDAMTNVTVQFPKAVELSLQVLRYRDEYYVCEPEDLTNPLNDKPLKKKAVNGFLKKQEVTEDETEAEDEGKE